MPSWPRGVSGLSKYDEVLACQEALKAWQCALFRTYPFLGCHPSKSSVNMRVRRGINFEGESAATAWSPLLTRNRPGAKIEPHIGVWSSGAPQVSHKIDRGVELCSQCGEELATGRFRCPRRSRHAILRSSTNRNSDVRRDPIGATQASSALGDTACEINMPH